jgi:exosortase A
MHAVTLAALAALLFLYRDTAARMVESWSTSESYSHGWLIVPVCLYLVWRRRFELAQVAARPSFAHLATVALAVLAWIAGAIANALVVQQLALVGLVAATVIAVQGVARARLIAFPLAFLVFAVPFGESLVGPLMQWTATGTIALLKLSGIPVYRDGMLFSTSAGDFEVARACSGIRYLTASAAVGLLYGYVALRERRHRVLFALLAVIVPIVANAVRAYLIVLLAHLSDMRIATGVDHFVYGWVFFGVVMIGVLLIGERLRRRERHADDPPVQRAAATFAPRAGRAAAVGVAALALIVSGPLFAGRVARQLALGAPVPHSLPVASGDWVGPLTPASLWQPGFTGAPAVLRSDYEHPALGRVTVAMIAYDVETQDAELVSDSNRFADDTLWRFVSATPATAQPSVRATRYQGVLDGSHLELWTVYALDGDRLSNPFTVKLRGTWRRLSSAPAAPVLIVMARHQRGEDASAATVLGEFARLHLPALVEQSRGKPAS